MGRGSGDVLKVIGDLEQSFPGLRAEMIATGQVFSKDAVEAGKKFDLAWDTFTGRWEGFMARIGGSAAVAMNAVIDAFAKMTAPQKEWLEETERVSKRLRELQTGVHESRGGGGSWDEAVKGIDRVAEAMTTFEKKTKQAKVTLEEMFAVASGAGAHFGMGTELRGKPPSGGVGPTEPILGYTPAGPQLTPFGELAGQLQALGEEMAFLTSGVNVAMSALNAFRVGIEQGFQAVFVGLLDETQTWGSALRKLWNSILNSLLSWAGKTAADSLFQSILPALGKFLLPLVPFLGAAELPSATAPVFAAGPRLSAPSAAKGPDPVVDELKALKNTLLQAMSQAARSPVQVAITANDSKSFQDFMTGPLGAGRLAELKASSGQGF